MKLKPLETFEFIGKTENVFCTRCKGYKIYRITGKRYRCKRCKYTFNDFSGRWNNKLRISYKKWLWIIKFFEVEISARKITQQTGLSYPTMLNAVNVLRMAILAIVTALINLTC